MSFYYRGCAPGDGTTITIPSGADRNGRMRTRGPFGRELYIQYSDGDGWEHVSVSTRDRCPVWDEMVFVRNLFWGPDDVVMELHPAKSDYVNTHPYCLHLWRPINQTIPTPPRSLV